MPRYSQHLRTPFAGQCRHFIPQKRRFSSTQRAAEVWDAKGLAVLIERSFNSNHTKSLSCVHFTRLPQFGFFIRKSQSGFYQGASYLQ
jgi:hypothetical protein